MVFDLFNGDKPFIELPSLRIECCFSCGWVYMPEPDVLANCGTFHKDTEWCKCGSLMLVLKLFNKG